MNYENVKNITKIIYPQVANWVDAQGDFSIYVDAAVASLAGDPVKFAKYFNSDGTSAHPGLEAIPLVGQTLDFLNYAGSNPSTNWTYFEAVLAGLALSDEYPFIDTYDSFLWSPIDNQYILFSHNEPAPEPEPVSLPAIDPIMTATEETFYTEATPVQDLVTNTALVASTSAEIAAYEVSQPSSVDLKTVFFLAMLLGGV